MITVRIESLGEVRGELEPLLWAHYDEVALYKDSVPLDVDWERYAALDQLGMLKVFTVRSGETLVGYAVFFVGPHMHYRRTSYANNDVLFVHPRYRGAGIRLIRFAERALKEMGVERILFHVKVDHDFRPILHRMGYADEDVIVGKLL